MGYKICKQTDEHIVLQTTGGIVDFIFGAVMGAIGAVIMSLGWFNYQDTGEIIMSLVFLLLGSCFLIPALKRNRVIVDVTNKQFVKTKSWFGITPIKKLSPIMV
tara:strand:+ start:6736 stop:7047 length:312 start_codon:yes stop_codon:yes gene_type:complete